jgi:cobalt/nickel transport system permease protein
MATVLIDRYAYANRWRAVHPVVKGVLTGLGMAASLASDSPLVPLLVMVVMSGATLLGARIPVMPYLRLLLVPAGFLLAGVVSLAMSLGGGDILLVTLPVFDLPLGLSHAGLHQAGLVLARSLGAVTCLYLLALTTPLTEIVGLLRRLGVPRLLLELMVLAYRQIFTLAHVAREMTEAQQSRLGYATAGNSLRSLAALTANLTLRTHQRSRQLHRALVARGYEEELHWFEREQSLPAGQLVLATTIGGVLLALALLVGG